MLEFFAVDETLVDIGDDLVDYEVAQSHLTNHLARLSYNLLSMCLQNDVACCIAWHAVGCQ